MTRASLWATLCAAILLATLPAFGLLTIGAAR